MRHKKKRDYTDLGIKSKHEIIRIDGVLKQVTTIRDASGNLLHKIISPLMVEFHPKDVLQVIVGASLLAIPVGFTEETWQLGITLPLLNVLLLFFTSLLFIGLFVYFTYHHKSLLRDHSDTFFKRIFATYILSFIVVAVLLTIIQRAPWDTSFLIALKRVIIVTFPASLGGAIVDTLK